MSSVEIADKTEDTHRFIRTNIVLDAELLESAMEYSGQRTRRAVVDEALRLFVRMGAQQTLLDMFGKVAWDGDLDELRKDRFNLAEGWGLDEAEHPG